MYFEDWTASQDAPDANSGNDFLENVASISDDNGNLFVANSAYNEVTDVHDLLLSKYDIDGNLDWSQTFNIQGGGDVLVGAMTLDELGNILITGAVENGANNYDALTLKYNSLGTLQWSQLYNGTSSHYDGGTSIVTNSLGDVFIAGVSTNTNTLMDFLVIRYSSVGIQQWVGTYNGNNLMDVAAGIALESSQVVISGASQSSVSAWSLVLLSLNELTGATNSIQSVLDAAATVESVQDFTKDELGNFYIVGATENTSGLKEWLVVKFASNLSILWQKTYDNDNEDAVANAVVVDDSGNVFVTGYAVTANGKDYLTLKYNAQGTEVWTATHNGNANLDDEGTDIGLNGSGEVFVTGYANEIGNSDYLTIQYDGAGNEVWSATYNSVYNREDKPRKINFDNSDCFSVTGRSERKENDDFVINTSSTRYCGCNVIIPPDEEMQSGAICFVKNNDQILDTDGNVVPNIKYTTDMNSPAIFFQDDIVSLVVSDIDYSPGIEGTLHRVDMSFIGLSRNRRLFSMEKRADYFNFYKPHIPEGRENVPLYKRLVYCEVFPNIDLQFSTNNESVKHYYVISPGGTPNSIRLNFNGQTGLSVINDELIIGTSIHEIILPKPEAYQIDNSGNKVPVNWDPAYLVNGSNLSFVTEPYNTSLPLVIEISEDEHIITPNLDGNLKWCTYYGGSNDNASETAFDVTQAANSIFISGTTPSSDFPVNPSPILFSGHTAAFVGKFDKPGERKWGTFYGGQTTGIGSATNAYSIISDGTSTYFTGRTNDPLITIKENEDFTNAYNNAEFGNGQKAYLAKLDESGALRWGTFLGKSSNSMGLEAKLNSNNHLFIVGVGNNNPSGSFPIEDNNGTYYTDSDSNGNGFLMEFGTEDTLVWSTLFSNNNSWVNDIAIDNENNIIISGVYKPSAGTHDFANIGGGYFDNTANGEEDCFIAKFTPDRQLYWSTLFGGISREEGFSVATDSKGNIYLTGRTTSDSSSFPLLEFPGGLYNDIFSGGFGDIFMSRFKETGVQEWTTFYRGSDDDGGDAISFGRSAVDCTIDQNDIFYVSGSTRSIDFKLKPLTGVFNQEQLNNIPDTTAARDGFIVAFAPNLKLRWGTFFGGRFTEIPYAINANGEDIFMVGWTQAGGVPKIPIENPDPSNPNIFYVPTGAHTDGFIAHFCINDVLIDTKEIATNEELGVFNVFPNPATDKVFLSIEPNVEILGKTATIVFYNVLGQPIHAQKVELQEGQVFALDTKDFIPSTYWISLQLGNQQITKKIILH